ncbi:MAG: hypothetical protein ACC655_07370, partial [Rhodothermia bacterium]
MSRPFDPPDRPPRLPLPPVIVPKLLLVLPMLLLVVSACSRPQLELPIPQDELPGVLIDIYVAEAEAELLGTDLTDARVDALRRRGYDTGDFDETIRLLTEDPEFAKKIYQTVLDSVIFEQREIRARRLTSDVGGRTSDVGRRRSDVGGRTSEVGGR